MTWQMVMVVFACLGATFIVAGAQQYLDARTALLLSHNVSEQLKHDNELLAKQVRTCFNSYRALIAHDGSRCITTGCTMIAVAIVMHAIIG